MILHNHNSNTTASLTGHGEVVVEQGGLYKLSDVDESRGPPRRVWDYGESTRDVIFLEEM